MGPGKDENCKLALSVKKLIKCLAKDAEPIDMRAAVATYKIIGSAEVLSESSVFLVAQSRGTQPSIATGKGIIKEVVLFPNFVLTVEVSSLKSIGTTT